MHYLVSFLDLTDLLSCGWIVYWEYSPTLRILPLIIDENLEKEEKPSTILHAQTEVFNNSWEKNADSNTRVETYLCL